MIALALALLAAPIRIDVYVPLCDAALIDCGRGALGDPRSLQGNLYWGARYGAERYLSRAPRFRVLARRDGKAPVLREVDLSRAPAGGEREIRMRLIAYAGDHIDDALLAFFAAAGSTSADLVVWAGHDRLMDVSLAPRSRGAAPGAVAVLACASERFFGPPLSQIGATPIAMTRTLMAPEAYLLEALAASVAARGVLDSQAHRLALAKAYSRYQRISLRAASSVFSKLTGARPQ